jgi:chromosome partitioning protein
MLTVKETSNLVGLTAQRVKQILNENSWEFERGKGNNGIIKVPPTTVRKIVDHRNLEFKNHQVIAISSQKGGVGKTFLSTNVAIIAASRGLKVCLIDIDPESCSTNTLLPNDTDYSEIKTMLEVFKQDLEFSDVTMPSRYANLDIVPCKPKARKSEKITMMENPKHLVSSKIEKLKEKYDLIMFDLPPNFSTLTASCYMACDLVVQPCFPNVYSMESVDLTNADIEEECENYSARMPEVKIILNSFRSTEKASREVRHELEKNFNDQLIHFEIGKYQDVSNLINEGLSVIDTKTKATADIMKFVDYLCPLNDKVLQ